MKGNVCKSYISWSQYPKDIRNFNNSTIKKKKQKTIFKWAKDLSRQLFKVDI